MAYVPGFEYDIFLSYASDDLDDNLKTFFNDLRVALRRQLGKDFSDEHGIFLDRSELNQSPIAWKESSRNPRVQRRFLFPYFHPRMQPPSFCGKEWEWFRDNPPLEWIAGNQTVYRVCPVAWREIEPELREQVAPDIRRAQEDRSLAAADLALKLANGLRMVRRSRETVYLGQSEHEIRGKVRDELSRMGFRVEPEAPSAFTDPET